MRRFAVAMLAVFGLCGATFGPPWPQCAVRSGVEGGPAIVIDGAPFSPIMFAANNQFGRDTVLIDELKKAAEAGVPFFSFNLLLDWHMTAEQAAETVDKFCKVHSEGYFYVRIGLGPGQAWADAHPGECIAKADGVRQPWPSLSSDVWRQEAGDLLRKRVEEIVEGPHARQFLGILITHLQTGEWFYADTNDFMDYSSVNLHAFRQWLKQRYRKEKDLRAAWNDPTVTFDSAQFPSPASRDTAVLGPFRNPAAQRPAMDMERFQNELVADTIAHFARIVKEATRNRSLVGAFYGYTMELNNNGPRALAHSGHLALARLLECEDVDLIHAPYSYFERRIGEPAHLHLPVDSVALHGKLAIIEEDTYTHLAQEPGPDLIAPGWPDRTASIDETLAVNRRNYGLFFTHRCGLWMFDLLSDGRWNDGQFWTSAAVMRRIAAELRGAPPFQPEVAFVIDEPSVACLRDTTHPVLLESLSHWRAELDRAGTPIGYYLQSDLTRLPESVKVVILANAYAVDDDTRRALDGCLDAGKTVLWTYAPDIAGPDGLDPRRIGAITGIRVEPRTGDVPMSIVSELTGETVSIDRAPWDPRFVVPEQDGIDVFSRYANG
ncbi:MAG: hypothetical protein QG656_103 [Candidatus Hydrogenedentes bacterium]|nr:hypothetical protein [Candidatus Hydrogenedentota bacterium]